jgi:Flp pilus assembly protein TadD
MEGTPPEVHRALGTMLRQAGDSAEAMRAFRRYLELKPDAEDAELIRSYVAGSQS